MPVRNSCWNNGSRLFRKKGRRTRCTLKPLQPRKATAHTGRPQRSKTCRRRGLITSASSFQVLFGRMAWCMLKPLQPRKATAYTGRRR